jgi:glycosyltransferase involved in cell wall biosynthesis
MSVMVERKKVGRNQEKRIRVAVLCDFAEERWPSMDLFGELHLQNLLRHGSRRLKVTRVCPPFRRSLTKLKRFDGPNAFSLDRVLNRLWFYPRFIKHGGGYFDVFHLIDHSYSQLVHRLPASGTVVTCHDLDTFRCLLEPEQEYRSFPFRVMTKRILDGFRRAARIVCVSRWTRDQIIHHGLVPAERLEIVPLGAAPEFNAFPDTAADAEADRLLGAKGAARATYLLHVGSVARRKRIDILLKTFAIVRSKMPQLVLVRVGGHFDEEQERLLNELDIKDSVAVLPVVRRDVLASLYRRAAAVLLPSEREGYGLPVIEAMACGTPVIASDLPVLREVGDDAVEYCDVGDCDAWSQAAIGLLRESQTEGATSAYRRRRGLDLAARSTPAKYAKQMLDIYATIHC